MRPTQRRSVNRDEVAIIHWLLDHPSVDGPLGHLHPSVDQLRVVSGCGCGCDTVNFVEFDKSARPKPLAEAVGTTAEGQDVGLILWARADQVEGLEVYDLSGRDAPGRLPVPDSLRPWRATDES